MKIDISDNAIFNAALKKAADDKPFEALCLFAQVDSYESMLNQIGCLALMDDMSYAVSLYRKLLARYVFTHNCVDDVRQMGEAAEEVLGYFNNDLKGEFAEFDPNKISAKKELLGYYGWGDDDYDEEELFDEYAEIKAFLADFPDESNNKFFVVNSPEYAQNIRERMISACVEGNLSKANELQKEFLSIDATDELTLELQLLLCHARQNWQEAERFALQIAKQKNATYRGLGMAAETLYNTRTHADVLETLLCNLAEYGEEIPDPDMMTYVQISAVCLGYGETTLKLTDILFSHYVDAGCSALNLCARVYFNCNSPKAREATLLLVRAAPWDGVAKALLTYLNQGIAIKLSDPLPLGGTLRRFDVPKELSYLSHYQLLNPSPADGKLHCQDLCYLDCILKMCSGYIVCGQAEEFLNLSTVVFALVDNSEPDDKDKFILFAKEYVASVISEANLDRCFLNMMINLGCRDKIFVSLLRGYYTLDLGKITLSDKRFFNAFAMCAAIRKVDVRRLEKSYLLLAERLTKRTSDRSLAYAMLALSYKNFTESDESELFADEEKKFYLKYIKN